MQGVSVKMQAMGVEELYQQAFQYRSEGRYAESKAVLQQVLKIEPRHLKALWLYGLVQGFEGDFDGSLRTLQRLVTMWPEEPDLRYDLAMTQVMLAMNDEAYLNFQEVLRQDPEHTNAKRQISFF